ncbi:hypothetical protein [Enterococcus sp. AZ196]|uniref:hypothetical protein n=1 Tax=Enterococcus sp. AZ196 TaxID=2774659 RepID=UPI003D26C467
MSKRNSNQLKKETALKNFRYSRFLLLRYLLAGFFFTNLYWALLLKMSHSPWVILPVLLIAISIPAIAEHLRLYGYPSDDVSDQLKFQRLYQRIQLSINGILLISILTNIGYSDLFPFLSDTFATKGAIIFIQLVGILLSEVVLRRVKKIYQQQDKHLSYITEFIKLNK